MKRAISILCSLLLIFQGNIVHAEQQPCDVVGYMVLWDIPLYEEVLNEKWTKDSTVLPFYMGALCIDRGFKFKVQHPVLGYWRLLKKLHRVS